ncbi:MAG TPA: HEPN domain-containing protein [Acidimicrobiia bacterium]|nr:HEPN domain-containing protein [Acidimicrobiia bacterium]
MSALDDLRNKGLIESVETDSVMAAQWLEDAQRHLEAAEAIADIDPSGAYVLAYDAARKSIAAALLTAGYRVRSRPGAHQALAQFASHLSAQTGEPALGRFDRLRRNRNRSEYGTKTFGRAEIEEAINTADAIRAACAGIS